MAFFNRRKIKDRRTGEKSEYNKPDRRSGKVRRKNKDRRLDKYHQLEPKRQDVINRIINILKEEANEE